MTNPVLSDSFHVPTGYFLSHSVGCFPKTTRETLETQFLEPWSNGRNWSDWMSVVDRFRAGIGNLIDASHNTICPQPTVSSALTKIIHALPKRESKTEILLSRHDFPTIGFVLKKAEQAGYKLRFIEGDPWSLDSWERAIGPQTAIVHVTHALSVTSHRLPVQHICSLARADDAVSIVDIAQSLIALPVSVTDWGADFAIGTGVKFLCGGPGACFLYVSPARMDDCTPVDVGWFSHEDPFEMDIEQFRYAPDAMRFFGGTPSPAPLSTANAAIELWTHIQLSALQRNIQNNIDRIISASPESWLRSPIDRDKRGATVCLSPPERNRFGQAANDANLHFDERETGFRFSLHGYTSDVDVRTLIDVIQSQ